jgi:hypothetical protein
LNASTHSQAKGATGVAQFRRAAPAGLPMDHIAKIEIFPGTLLQKRNSNSKSEWLILVNCVGNHRKIRKM